MRRRVTPFFSEENTRFWVLTGFFLFFFGMILSKLFFLQVVQGEALKERAKEMRSSSIEISARRGGIFTQDSKTGELAPLAINTTLYKVFVDARSEVTTKKNLEYVAEFLTEELYSKEVFQKCLDNSNTCPKGSVIEITDQEGVVIHRTFPSYKKAKDDFKKDLLEKISVEKTDLVYATEVDEKVLREIENMRVPHVFVSLEKKHVRVDLQNISEENATRIVTLLFDFFGGDTESIRKKLTLDRKGYIPIMSRVHPEVRERILKKKEKAQKTYLSAVARYNRLKKSGVEAGAEPENSPLRGIGFDPEPIRYYPEGTLLSNVVGFVSGNIGRYGVEKHLETFLSGENGVFETARDVHGNAVSVQKKDTEKVVDGGNVVLTIDRILQQRVEKILDEKRKEYKADSVQAILTNPKTGEILVMANSPRFDPNYFGEVYARRRTTPDDFENIYKTTPLEKKDREGAFITGQYTDFKKSWELGFDPEFYMFENGFGPSVYSNKTVSSLYEPGSVIKPLVMAAALEEGEITVNSRYFESSPLEVGPFTIENADKLYLGSQTMSNIIERSANIGMAFIAEKMGKPLLYDSLKKMGFGEYTDISLPDELAGEVKYYKTWSDARMYNASFGQGFSSTPLQVMQAWGALANGGFLIPPRVVSYVEHADGTKDFPEKSHKRIFSRSTVEDMKKILISSTEHGVAKSGKVKGHYIAGKTGTSQITRIDGTGYEDLDEKGSTITGFIGFAPVDNPEFLLLVKFDRPREALNGRSVFGSSTAAPVFSEIMKMLFFYYDTPNDKF